MHTIYLKGYNLKGNFVERKFNGFLQKLQNNVPAKFKKIISPAKLNSRKILKNHWSTKMNSREIKLENKFSMKFFWFNL